MISLFFLFVAILFLILAKLLFDVIFVSFNSHNIVYKINQMTKTKEGADVYFVRNNQEFFIENPEI